ncbi:hypothetical protein Egran_04655 [Elaphomyces granulatus]|uniref:Uncharacterized protein n=1 Tax=Elaphomyces granulatus TaxID=519963 RepID=A0A232LTT6_9EURO|nr:hypothetical protein Egran_04655 [Elaphomyces granulatus]
MSDNISGWFPYGRNNTSGWRFDAVSLIAVLGESLIARHIQPLSASKWCLLPRLIPAPQSFLLATRPPRLPSSPATVCGVHSKTVVDELNYFADIMHSASEMKAFQVAVFRVELANLRSRMTRRSRTFMTVRHSNTQLDDEFHYQKHHALIPPASMSPLNALTVVSCLITIGAFVWAFLVQDGGAALALATMSFASILIGIASYWTPLLAKRPTKSLVIEGDVVLRSRQGAFVIIECSEEVARELYTGPEECLYMVGSQWFNLLVGIGTILVMISVVLLGNCNWTMQVVIVGIYTLLNSFYWLVALLPKQWLWDMSRYHCEDITPERMKNAGVKGPNETPSFTRSLWFAIQVTKETEWVSISKAAPKTDAWDKWLRMAQENCDNPDWDAVGEKNKLMEESVNIANRTPTPTPPTPEEV